MHKAKTKPEEFKRLLRAQGLRATPIRLQILQILKLSKNPLTVEQLFDKVAAKIKACDLVTVYRNMNQFSEVGLVHQMDLGVDKKLYEFSGDNGHHHHHVVCQKCRKIDHLEVCGLESHMKMVEAMGYKNVTHRLEFFALCKSCA